MPVGRSTKVLTSSQQIPRTNLLQSYQATRSHSAANYQPKPTRPLLSEAAAWGDERGCRTTLGIAPTISRESLWPIASHRSIQSTCWRSRSFRFEALNIQWKRICAKPFGKTHPDLNRRRVGVVFRTFYRSFGRRGAATTTTTTTIKRFIKIYTADWFYFTGIGPKAV